MTIDADNFVVPLSDPASACAVRAWAIERVVSGNNRLDDPEIVEALNLVKRLEQVHYGS
jgi:hypothetical protein